MSILLVCVCAGDDAPRKPICQVHGGADLTPATSFTAPPSLLPSSRRLLFCIPYFVGREVEPHMKTVAWPFLLVCRGGQCAAAGQEGTNHGRTLVIGSRGGKNWGAMAAGVGSKEGGGGGRPSRRRCGARKGLVLCAAGACHAAREPLGLVDAAQRGPGGVKEGARPVLRCHTGPVRVITHPA